jgi:extracellular elastinolytic metalloproteinase
LSSTTGIKQLTSEKIEVSVYPNPAKNNATIELNLTKEETITINVLSVMGQVVYSETLNASAGVQTINLNSSTWADGIYNVNITTNNGSVSRKLEVIK